MDDDRNRHYYDYRFTLTISIISLSKPTFRIDNSTELLPIANTILQYTALD